MISGGIVLTIQRQDIPPTISLNSTIGPKIPASGTKGLWKYIRQYNPEKGFYA
jgi:hypothetical protein